MRALWSDRPNCSHHQIALITCLQKLNVSGAFLKIVHLGALKIVRFSNRAVEVAAATAENCAILVHSSFENPSSKGVS